MQWALLPVRWESVMEQNGEAGSFLHGSRLLVSAPRDPLDPCEGPGPSPTWTLEVMTVMHVSILASMRRCNHPRLKLHPPSVAAAKPSSASFTSSITEY